MSNANPLPSITVVLCTRDRGARLTATIDTILANKGTTFDLRIIDQSDDDSTHVAVRGYLDRPGMNYVCTRQRGLAAARNLGIAQARTELIAMTDDDCLVAPNWLAEMARAFETDARVAVVFGNAVADAHDSRAGFIPAYVRSGSYLARSMADKHCVEGMGACMALRRSAWERLGGFDEMLGTGSRFRAGEEVDLAMRALQAGYAVYETDRVQVVHQGWRTMVEKPDLTYGCIYSIGAVYSKHLKCHRWSALIPLAQLAWRWVFAKPVVDYGVPPPRGLRLKGFCRGFCDGARTPVNRRQGLYRSCENGNTGSPA